MAKFRTRNQADRVRRAFARLRPIEREVLGMSAGESLRTDEIAARLGLPVETVRNHLVEAICALDRQLERLERPWWSVW